MAEVWAAEDLELGRSVAIKLLGRDADRERFEREARAAAALSHPNIVGLYDYGDVEGRPYIVFEHLPGGTLEERLTGSPLADGETARIATGLAEALGHAHARGLVHRDLKPANVLFDAEGRPKLADLGIARMAAEGTLTAAGTVMGTAAYISPEQAAGETATPASDVYSFGVLLFRMLTGRLPFESEQPLELVRKHLEELAPAVSSVRAGAPAALERLAARTLAKDPGERPVDGAALLDELRTLTPLRPAAADEATAVLPRRGPTRAGRPRLPAAALLAGLVVLAAAGAAVAILSTDTDSKPAVETATRPKTKASRPASRRAPAPPRATPAAATTERTTGKGKERTAGAPTTPAAAVSTEGREPSATRPAVARAQTTRTAPTVAPTVVSSTIAPSPTVTEPEPTAPAATDVEEPTTDTATVEPTTTATEPEG